MQRVFTILLTIASGVGMGAGGLGCQSADRFDADRLRSPQPVIATPSKTQKPNSPQPNNPPQLNPISTAVNSSPVDPPANTPAQAPNNAPNNASNNPQNGSQNSAPAGDVPASITSANATATPIANPIADPVTRLIAVYQANLACDQLQPRTLELPSGDRLTEIEAAINVILKQWTAGDFAIAGYRVTLTETTAIVDLRAAPDQARPWQALSTCEQLALFLAIRTTLTQHSAWAIEDVAFTSLGTPINP